MGACRRAGTRICGAQQAHLALNDRDMAAGGPPAAAARVPPLLSASRELAALRQLHCKPQIKLGAMHARLATGARLSRLF